MKISIWPIIAGSGPSAQSWQGQATITTKKITVPGDYIYVPHVHFWHTFRQADRARPLIVRKRTCTCKKCRDCHAPVTHALDWRKWWNYYAKFNPKFSKPSIGTEAVFVAIQLWDVKRVALIGFDGILDGTPIPPHDHRKELQCLQSLVEIVDLRKVQKGGLSG